MASEWTGGTLTITQNGVTTVVPTTGNAETVASAITRGAVLTLINGSGNWTIVISK